MCLHGEQRDNRERTGTGRGFAGAGQDRSYRDDRPRFDRNDRRDERPRFDRDRDDRRPFADRRDERPRSEQRGAPARPASRGAGTPSQNRKRTDKPRWSAVDRKRRNGR